MSNIIGRHISMNEIPDDLIKKAASGDIEAFEEIYRSFSAFVFRVVLRVTQNTHDAEEVTQDVFVKVFNSLKNFGFRSQFKTWVYRIAVNLAINKYKASSRERKRNLDIDEVGDLVSTQEDATKSVERQEFKEQADILLARLNPEMRACVVLREMEGLDYKEIAETLNIPINTVRSRLKRAREALMAHAERQVVKHEV